MPDDLPPSIRELVERQKKQELEDPAEDSQNEHSIRNTMHRRQVETSYMRIEQHREDRE